VDVDARLWTPRGPHANARLRGDARGRDGGVRQKLAAGAFLRSGGGSAFGGKPEHICSLRGLPVLTRCCHLLLKDCALHNLALEPYFAGRV